MDALCGGCGGGCPPSTGGGGGMCETRSGCLKDIARPRRRGGGWQPPPPPPSMLLLKFSRPNSGGGTGWSKCCLSFFMTESLLKRALNPLEITDSLLWSVVLFIMIRGGERASRYSLRLSASSAVGLCNVENIFSDAQSFRKSARTALTHGLKIKCPVSSVDTHCSRLIW